MKIQKLILTCVSFFLITSYAYTQDRRTLETKVADLLALFPASDARNTDKLMNDMLQLGEAGIIQICDQIIPAGSGNDTQPRFAVESLSRYLSQPGKESDKKMWEKICIRYAVDKKDNMVKDFFMKQLEIIGGDSSVEAMKNYLSNKELCEPAIGVIASIGGKKAEGVLAASLKNQDLPCPSTVMNVLARMNSQIAVNDYIYWASNSNKDITASAYNAMAQSGSAIALPVLSQAAKNAEYKWEATGATNALLNYAKTAGENGDIKTMDKICKTLISKCKDISTLQYKTAALDTYVGFHGYDAMNYLLDAAKNTDDKYRNAALRMSLEIPEKEVVSRWMAFYDKAPAYAKPDIITMLGIRNDKQAIPLLKASLGDSNVKVRQEAALALASLEGNNAISSLIDYMLKNNSTEDQKAAKTAIMTVAGKDNMNLFIPVLKGGSTAAQRSAIEILAWKKDQKYFREVYPFTSSENDSVKYAAFKALPELAGPGDQEKLIALIIKTENPAHIGELQKALQSSANQVSDQGLGSGEIIKAIKTHNNKEKLIPVLAKTGGKEALQLVQKEYQEGNAVLRDISFKTLTEWKDHSASSALFEIVASGNENYETPAFEGYVRQIRSANLPDEQKLLLFRKIMPYAKTTARKNTILNELARLRTYQSLFFVANYFKDPEIASTAARASMSIALPSDDSKIGMNGTLVRNILTAALPHIKGQESDYEKEMLNKYLAEMPLGEGFSPMFNGKDLSGWQGLVGSPLTRAKMTPDELSKKQLEADQLISENWSVRDGSIWFTGKGRNLCSVKEYSDFEMLVDWVISKNGDSGIYLRGTPQVQIWDTSRVEVGAQVGSGGLYNNKIHPSIPLKVVDNPVGDWNTFRILMKGEKVSVWLNGEIVVDNVTMENYWDRSIPIFPNGAVELQAHGTELGFRDIYIREINEKENNLSPEEKADGFVSLFNGKNLDNWVGDKQSYVVEDNTIAVKPVKGSGGNLFTEKEYSDFIYRFEFLLPPGANNGLGIRAPLQGDAAYLGMELQILDDTAPIYAKLQPYQYHGSIYGVVPAKRGHLKPVGEWNYQEVIAKGSHIKIILNGTVIVDDDIAGPRDQGTMDKKNHPGLHNKSGHIGFLGHGSEVKFRNIRIKEISE